MPDTDKELQLARINSWFGELPNNSSVTDILNQARDDTLADYFAGRVQSKEALMQQYPGFYDNIPGFTHEGKSYLTEWDANRPFRDFHQRYISEERYGTEPLQRKEDPFTERLKRNTISVRQNNPSPGPLGSNDAYPSWAFGHDTGNPTLDERKRVDDLDMGRSTLFLSRDYRDTIVTSPFEMNDAERTSFSTLDSYSELLFAPSNSQAARAQLLVDTALLRSSFAWKHIRDRFAPVLGDQDAKDVSEIDTLFGAIGNAMSGGEAAIWAPWISQSTSLVERRFQVKQEGWDPSQIMEIIETMDPEFYDFIIRSPNAQQIMLSRNSHEFNYLLNEGFTLQGLARDNAVFETVHGAWATAIIGTQDMITSSVKSSDMIGTLALGAVGGAIKLGTVGVSSLAAATTGVSASSKAAALVRAAAFANKAASVVDFSASLLPMRLPSTLVEHVTRLGGVAEGIGKSKIATGLLWTTTQSTEGFLEEGITSIIEQNVKMSGLTGFIQEELIWGDVWESAKMGAIMEPLLGGLLQVPFSGLGIATQYTNMWATKLGTKLNKDFDFIQALSQGINPYTGTKIDINDLQGSDIPGQLTFRNHLDDLDQKLKKQTGKGLHDPENENMLHLIQALMSAVSPDPANVDFTRLNQQLEKVNKLVQEQQDIVTTLQEKIKGKTQEEARAIILSEMKIDKEEDLGLILASADFSNGRVQLSPIFSAAHIILKTIPNKEGVDLVDTLVRQQVLRSALIEKGLALENENIPKLDMLEVAGRIYQINSVIEKRMSFEQDGTMVTFDLGQGVEGDLIAALQAVLVSGDTTHGTSAPEAAPEAAPMDAESTPKGKFDPDDPFNPSNEARPRSEEDTPDAPDAVADSIVEATAPEAVTGPIEEAQAPEAPIATEAAPEAAVAPEAAKTETKTASDAKKEAINKILAQPNGARILAEMVRITRRVSKDC